MSAFIRRFKLSRFAWTVLVTVYCLTFFTNFFRDSIPAQMVIPTLFAYLFVLWLSLEYYFGSPFFQSGVAEHSAFWRGIFAFFAYPLLGYVAADFIWWHWTQIPLPALATGVLGLAVFGFGTFVRLDTLFGLLRIAQVRNAPKGAKEDFITIPEKRFVGLRFQRLTRQLIGASLAFRSWGGLVLVLAVGLPLIMVQARYEDQRLKHLLKSELDKYVETVPAFWPRLRQS
jgi:hypothetical protein